MVNKESLEKDINEKKRRKTSSDVGTSKQSKEEVYESIIRHEEEEAKTRAAKEDMALFHQTCGELKTIFDEIATLKKDNSEKAKSEILEKRIQGSLIFVLLKKLNRLDKIRLRSGRDALHKEKLRVDSNRLQLQNLLYELNHLKREVEHCYQFKSQDEEIELVSEEEFYATAPEIVSRPDKTKSDEHSKRLARLEWELQQRKELSALVKELTVSKESVSKDISLKVERLNSLAPCLEALLIATRPLQTALDMEIEKEWEVQQSVRLLPRPLYLVYVNLSAYGEACDKYLKVSIAEDEEEMRQIEDEDKISDLMDETLNDDNQESDGDENEISENIPRKKYHKRKSTVDSKEVKRKNLFKAHPLRVVISFEKRGSKEQLTLTLHYFENLNLITLSTKVEIENLTSAAGAVVSAENVLNNLYANDRGECSPNPKTKYQLREFEMTEKHLLEYFNEKDYGKPFKWVQRLCGLNFPASDEQESTSSADFNEDKSVEWAQNSVPAIVKTIRSRWLSRLNLYQQIQALENKNIEPVDSTSMDVDEDNCSTLRISSSLVQWTNLSWLEYSSDSSTQQFVEFNVVSEHDMFYRAIITRNSAKLECLISIPSGFPNKYPIWSLCLFWNGKHNSQTNQAIREMEMWTNSIEINSVHKKNILSAQLKRTMTSLDIFLETEGPLYSPAEFVQDKTFLQPFRGRTRSRPFKSVQIGSNTVFKQIEKL
ncbi:THO complex subunit 5 homolog [Condylostylus longicornis]|uniref:THO complex subunit 5 homolog n=1 Tax=Condylostylus longicornis TaxID=2530218 RepID=UPI00244E500D|nr:THO complex subunit 5 homolog [Condylostylus longicornis]